MPAHAIRAIPVVTAAVAILIQSIGGALAACAPCACIPVKACAVAPTTLRVEQGPPDYDAMVAALEGPPALRRYPYIRSWYGYPHWWATRILAVGPSMAKYRSHRRCHVCGRRGQPLNDLKIPVFRRGSRRWLESFPVRKRGVRPRGL